MLCWDKKISGPASRKFSLADGLPDLVGGKDTQKSRLKLHKKRAKSAFKTSQKPASTEHFRRPRPRFLSRPGRGNRANGSPGGLDGKSRRESWRRPASRTPPKQDGHVFCSTRIWTCVSASTIICVSSHPTIRVTALLLTAITTATPSSNRHAFKRGRSLNPRQAAKSSGIHEHRRPDRRLDLTFPGLRPVHAAGAAPKDQIQGRTRPEACPGFPAPSPGNPRRETR
jgi:hypothetical protein